MVPSISGARPGGRRQHVRSVAEQIESLNCNRHGLLCSCQRRQSLHSVGGHYNIKLFKLSHLTRRRNFTIFPLSLRVVSKVWSAAHYSLRPSSHFSPFLSSGIDSLLPLLDLWERRHLTRGALRNYTGDIELDQFFIFPAASAALAQRRSSLASRCTFSFWLCATSSSLSFPAVPFSPKSPRVARTLQAEETGWRTSQLDCPKVGRTRQAEEPGSRCSHLHQVGEDSLNSEVASEVPAGWWYRRDSRAQAEDIFGEAFARALTTTMDFGNTPGLRAEGRWQCRARLCGRWFF